MELEIIKAVQNLNSRFFDIFCEFISFFSNYFGFIFLFLILFAFLNKKYALCFGITYGLGVGANFLLKFLFNRPRPYEVDLAIVNKLSATGKAFPSGHSVSATIIVFFILYYVFKSTKNKLARITCIVLSVLFILAVAFSRMYLGQHYLTDIIAGITFGLICSLLGILCYNYIIMKSFIFEIKKSL